MNFNNCKSCKDGKYIIKDGKYGFFVGCDNYPNCKSNITIAEYVKNYLEENGINIYKWKKQCPKCKKQTNVISYFLNYELKKYNSLFEMIGNVGIGDIPFIDKILMEKYENVKIVRSKTTDEEYVANICEFCGCLQGHNYVVDDPHEIWNDLIFEENIDKYLLENIKLNNVFIPYKELNIFKEGF